MKSLILQICTYISMLLKEYVTHITAFLSLLNVNEIQKRGGEYVVVGVCVLTTTEGRISGLEAKS